MAYYLKSAEEVLNELNVDRTQGLNDAQIEENAKSMAKMNLRVKSHDRHLAG